MARSTSSTGNWLPAPSAARLIAKFKQIEPYMEPPFVVETLAKAPPAVANGDGTDAEGESAETEKAEKKAAKTLETREGSGGR